MPLNPTKPNHIYLIYMYKEDLALNNPPMVNMPLNLIQPKRCGYLCSCLNNWYQINLLWKRFILKRNFWYHVTFGEKAIKKIFKLFKITTLKKKKKRTRNKAEASQIFPVDFILFLCSDPCWEMVNIYIYEGHTISFQTFFVWALLLRVHTWISTPLRSNLLQLLLQLFYRSNNVWKAPWKSSCVSVSMTFVTASFISSIVS